MNKTQCNVSSYRIPLCFSSVQWWSRKVFLTCLTQISMFFRWISSKRRIKLIFNSIPMKELSSHSIKWTSSVSFYRVTSSKLFAVRERKDRKWSNSRKSGRQTTRFSYDGLSASENSWFKTVESEKLFAHSGWMKFGKIDLRSNIFSSSFQSKKSLIKRFECELFKMFYPIRSISLNFFEALRFDRTQF